LVEEFDSTRVKGDFENINILFRATLPPTPRRFLQRVRNAKKMLEIT
jgi:hypothetical protein